MDLSEIVSVSGKPGLHQLKSQTNEGFIVQSLDGGKIKFIRNVSNRLVPLENITIYSIEEEDIELKEVFKRMFQFEEDKDHPPVKPKAPEDELREYFGTVVPEHDESQVYPSDIKKAIQWYHILREQDILTKEALKEEEQDQSDSSKNKKSKKKAGKNSKGKKKKRKSSKKQSS